MMLHKSKSASMISPRISRTLCFSFKTIRKVFQGPSHLLPATDHACTKVTSSSLSNWRISWWKTLSSFSSNLQGSYPMVRGPDGLFVNQFVELSCDFEDEQVAPGDRLTLPKAFESPSYEVLEAYIRPYPEDQKPDTTYPPRLQVVLRLRIANDPLPECVRMDDQRKVTVDVLEGYVCSGIVLARTEPHMDVELYMVPVDSTDDFPGELIWRHGIDVLESKRFADLWTEFQEREATEGVRSELNNVPDELRASLLKGINGVAEQETKDYHPGTNNIVRDHVHPSLYPYIKGVSENTGSKGKERKCKKAKVYKSDFWGRPYEDSIYQWLPAQFFIDSEGKCSIKSYINNLSKDRHPSLYSDLERLFEIFLPRFEDVYSYIKAAQFRHPNEDDPMEDLDYADGADWTFDAPPPQTLRDRELQVVTKIVDYELSPGQSFDGVWHVEGMSHENIVATGIYVIERSDGIEGGDLYFKRAFLTGEASKVFFGVPQCRHLMTEKMIREGLVPLGKLGTEEHRTIVFPNSHVHKVGTLRNGGDKDSYRRIIVFFLINPDVDIISTRDVEPQQGVIPRENALQHRLKLMEERKRHKQDWNVRTIELCEH